MKSNYSIFFTFVVILSILKVVTCSSPNIVVILTDDQDLLLESLNYLPKIEKLLVNKGAKFSNAVSFQKSQRQLIFRTFSNFNYSSLHRRYVVHQELQY